MDPRDFHALASRLAGGSVAERRTAVGRSYYAVFDVAVHHLRRAGFPIAKGAAAHGEVRLCLLNAGSTAVVRVGSDLLDLHGNRNKADYQLDHVGVEKPGNVKSDVELAGRLIALLDEAFLGLHRQQIVDAIGTWRRANGYR